MAFLVCVRQLRFDTRSKLRDKFGHEGKSVLCDNSHSSAKHTNFLLQQKSNQTCTLSKYECIVIYILIERCGVRVKYYI